MSRKEFAEAIIPLSFKICDDCPDSVVSGDLSPSGTVPYPLTSSSGLPSAKRRGTFRKWLSNPVRKLSHGRVEKTSSESTKPLSTKKSSQQWKSLNDKEDMGNKFVSPECTEKDEFQMESEKRETNIITSVEEEEVCEVELPPPMKIQEHSFTPVPPSLSEGVADKPIALPAAEGSSSTDLASELEQIVKERMEHHTEKRSEDTPSKMQSDILYDKEKDKALQGRKCVMQELIDTEVDYVKDLSGIVEGYMKCMRSEDVPMPEDLANGKDRIIFGNIEAIFEWHRDTFLPELQNCMENMHNLGMLFRRYERKLHMYVIYCQNKPKSEYIVAEHLNTYFEELRQRLDHKLQFPDLLIKPIQRIMKYQLLLKDILRYTEQANLEEEAQNLRKAVHIMHIVPKTANDMMNVNRLQGFQGKLTNQGQLLLQGHLRIGEPGSKLKDRQVFLFEQIIIFSEMIGPKSQYASPSYLYKNHLQMNKVMLEEYIEEKDMGKFVLRSKDPLQGDLMFIVQGPSLEITQEWRDKIRFIINTQMDFLIALQSPIAYQKEMNKESSECMWNLCLSKNLSPSAAAHPRSVNQERTDEACHPSNNPDTSSKEMAGPFFESHWYQSAEKCLNVPQRSPSRGVRRVLEGFRNSLWPKSKSDCSTESVSGVRNSELPRSSKIIRNWSDINSIRPTSYPSNSHFPGQ